MLKKMRIPEAESIWLLLWGALAAASYAPCEVPLMQCCGLIALAAAVIQCRTPSIWRLVLWWHLGFFGFGSSWVYVSLHQYGHISALFGILLAVGMATLLAIFPCVSLQGWHWLQGKTTRFSWQNRLGWQAATWAAAWLIGENLRLLVRYPWLSIAHAHTHGPFAWFSPFLGEYGLVLLISGLCYLLASWLCRRRQIPWLKLAVAAACVQLLSYLPAIPFTSPVSQGQHAVSIIQGNIPQTIKWTTQGQRMAIQRYAHNPANQCTDCLVIWPETTWPALLTRYDMDSPPFGGRHSPLLTGALWMEHGRLYNASLLVTLENKPEITRKRWLVPFGEYWPLGESTRSWLDRLNFTMVDMSSGRLQQPLQTWRGLHLLTAICYEIAFAWPFEQLSPQGNLWVVLTNDTWFGHSLAVAQHLQITRFRALSSQKPALFVNSNGLSSYISPNGKVITALPFEKFAVLNVVIEPWEGNTPMAYLGFWLLLLAYGVVLLAAVCAILNKKQSSLRDED